VMLTVLMKACGDQAESQEDLYTDTDEDDVETDTVRVRDWCLFECQYDSRLVFV